jgi:hypothetical protein
LVPPLDRDADQPDSFVDPDRCSAATETTPFRLDAFFRPEVPLASWGLGRVDIRDEQFSGSP